MIGGKLYKVNYSPSSPPYFHALIMEDLPRLLPHSYRSYEVIYHCKTQSNKYNLKVLTLPLSLLIIKVLSFKIYLSVSLKNERVRLS